MSSRKGMWGLLAGLGLLAAVAAACGGGSSSNTGPSAGGGGGSSGGSGAVIQGQLVRVQSAELRESFVVVALRTTFGVGLAEAAVGGLTVNLLDSLTLAVVQTTQTSSQGNFIFTNVPPGSYTIEVRDATNVVLVQDSASTVYPIVVGVGDVATLSGKVTDSTVVIGQVNVVVVDVGNLLQNSAQLCHAISISTATGANLGDVIDARLAGGGHGWGNVAKQFGAPPSVLGNNSCTESEISSASATASSHGNGKGKKKGQS